MDDVLCKIVCYICIDLHVMYVFLYLFVMDLKLESGYDMCYIFSHCIYFLYIFILSCRTICRYKYMYCWMIYRCMSSNRASVTKE